MREDDIGLKDLAAFSRGRCPPCERECDGSVRGQAWSWGTVSRFGRMWKNGNQSGAAQRVVRRVRDIML